MAGLFIVLDHMNFLEQQTKLKLSHDGGKLLKFLLARLSILPNQWKHGYCFEGQKKTLEKEAGTHKKERQQFLRDHLTRLHERMVLAKDELGEMQIVGFGRLACECLTGSTELKKRSGTTWKPLPIWRDLTQRVWICYSTDAALFDPVQVVEMSGVLARAAERVGIITKTRIELPMFDWSEYI